jgi:hypothetical protein
MRPNNKFKWPEVKGILHMKSLGKVVILVVLGLWSGYYLGHRNGVQEERRAWLATEQSFSDFTGGMAINRHARPHMKDYDERTCYSNPHSGQMRFVSFGRTRVNVPDPRNTPIK